MSDVIVNTLKPKYDALVGALLDPGSMREGAALALLDNLLDEVSEAAAAGESWRETLLGVVRDPVSGARANGKEQAP